MFQKIRRHAEPDYALAGVLPIGIGADRFVLRRGRIAEERGREQEGQREHRSRAATLDLRSADNCFAHLHTGHSETRSNHRRTFYRTALGVSTAFECSLQSAERDAARCGHFHTCRPKLGPPPFGESNKIVEPNASQLSGELTMLRITANFAARLPRWSIPDTAQYVRDVRFSLVVSTGRRNTCIKSFCWGFNSQGFGCPFVELTHHFV